MPLYRNQARSLYAIGLLLLLSLFSFGQKESAGNSTPWADWVEPDFPFFSSILDARKAGSGFPKDNLTPRGIILNLGNNHWACFDTDLLRISAIWKGNGVTPIALAPKSYHPWGSKTSGGQTQLPEPDGDIWIANGIYPGWQHGERLELGDPREPAPSPEEVGRGPLPEEWGRFKAIQLSNRGVILEYNAADALVRENFNVSKFKGRSIVERHFEIGPSSQTLTMVLGLKAAGGVTLGQKPDNAIASLSIEQSRWILRIPPHESTLSLCVSFTENGSAPQIAPRAIPRGKAKIRWPQEVTTRLTRSPDDEAYVVDPIDLPLINPWKRNVRPGDIQFLSDGTGIIVTIDGDLWKVFGLQDPSQSIRWKRFTSGLHEHMSAAIRDDQIFVFDRNGIWKILDTDGNGEADTHELFSNAFAQTADMREFPSTIRLAPEGEFVIAKGGQQASTLGKHNGSVLRISADGRHSTVLGYGFRQPSIGVNPRTGLVTSSDQEGQYIPSTPLHIVADKQFYGYLSEGLQETEKYPAPIADPLTWIPHAVNASATSQLWLFDAKMGPLNDSFVHIGFNRPELFKILLNHRGSKPQASVVSITSAFDYPLLNGSLNPADGQLYISGFQINGWGNGLDTLKGFGRVRYTGKQAFLPIEVAPMDKGVLLRFERKLDPSKATDPNSYSLASWHYRRTHRYGSAQYTENGETGIDWLTPSSAYLSHDQLSVFVGIPNMKPVMQLRVGWSLQTQDGMGFEENAYTTIYDLPYFDPIKEGFDDFAVDLTPRAAAARDEGPVSIEEGRRLYELMGCVACHSTTGGDITKIGPSWGGLYGKEKEVVVNRKRTSIKVDDAYLRESILDPTAKVVRGFEKGEYAMPSYAGVLNDSQIESLVLFIKSID